MKLPMVGLLLLACAFVFLAEPFLNSVQAKDKDQSTQDIYAKQEGQVELGYGLGFVSGSPNGTQLAQSFSADYYVHEKVSIGALMQLVPPGDYSHLSGALVSKYHWHLCYCGDKSGSWYLVPLLGLGGIHAELNKGGTHSKDMSYFAVYGLSLEVFFNSRFGFSATYMNNLHDLKLGDGRDRHSDTFFFGVRFALQPD